ncbi:hypothetical protein QFC21_000470 [Naganishia friedmannii]|uniref:Uncharacterized protein n=1 Tax=Naganishia friedmannii TaxID=89922 RepID=A0ACC2WF20_9TREE|nr:hypothetical protein QFC21_000470 [Naganishia friedmannii]
MDAHAQASLPSLTQLRHLQRANSAASRLQTLERLTGEQPGALARSNTVAAVGGDPVDAMVDEQGPRSGGLERRSVVGRMMMERLGNRIAARQQQQQQKQAIGRAASPSPPEIHLHPPPSAFPFVDTCEDLNVRSTPAAGSDSGSAVFEYEAHLSRNPSVRAAAAVVAILQSGEGESRTTDPADLEREGGRESQSRAEEVLVSPSRPEFEASSETPQTWAPVRYTLQHRSSTSSPIASGAEQYQQTPPRNAESSEVAPGPHYTSPSSSSTLSSARSHASGITIPFVISSETAIPYVLDHASMPTRLPPALESVITTNTGTREQDTMSSYPQAVASGVGSGYFQQGYFDRAQEMKVSEQDDDNEDARSDVTEKVAATASRTGVVDRDLCRTSRSPSLMSWEDIGQDSQARDLPAGDEPATSTGPGVIHRIEQSLRDTFRRNRTSRDESLLSSALALNEDLSAHTGNPPPTTQLKSSPVVQVKSGTITRDAMIPSYSLPPGQTSPMPTADPRDVRLQNAKLSPFLPSPSSHTGFGAGAQRAGFTPGPILQQASDSALPTLAAMLGTQGFVHGPEHIGSGLGSSTASLPDTNLNASQTSSSATSYYDLAPSRQGMASPTNEAVNALVGSAPVVTKKSWLAEAFFAGAQGNAASSTAVAGSGQSAGNGKRPSFSGISRRKPSILERYSARKEQRDKDRHPDREDTASPTISLEAQSAGSALAPPIALGVSAMPVASIQPIVSPLASISQSTHRPPPSDPQIRRGTSPRLASESSTMSTVLEIADERSTVYNAMSAIAPTAMQPQCKASTARARLLPTQTTEVMQKLNAVLALAPDARPDVLDDPPRRLVMSLPTVKDRHLFLFSDILVIAKPLPAPESGTAIAMDGSFSVKSVVPLQHLKVTADQQEQVKGDVMSAKSRQIVQQFIARFAQDPEQAVHFLEQNSSRLHGDLQTLASVLFKTAELDKDQLGKYLAPASRVDLLHAFLDRFHFSGLPLEQALRMFLLAIRLPPDRDESERMVSVMAKVWYYANASNVQYDASLAAQLALAIVRLNSCLNNSSQLATSPEATYPHATAVYDDFAAPFLHENTDYLIPAETLCAIFESVRDMQLAQALTTAEVEHQSRAITLVPARLPSRMTHNIWSEPIRIAIPEPDVDFKVELFGNGLTFDPPRLEFSMGNVATFRIKGEKLGLRTVLFRRLGVNAPKYGSLANTHTFVIERSFMQHIFHLTFHNHLGTKRKYVYSLRDSEKDISTDNLFAVIQQRVDHTREVKSNWKDTAVMSSSSRQLADQISIKVLQTSLIDTTEERRSGGSRISKKDVPVNSQSRRTSNPAAGLSIDHAVHAEPGTPQDIWKNTISPALEQTNQFDAPTPDGEALSRNVSYKKTQPAAGPVTAKTHTGKDIVFICRQNSLLPVVLGFLRYGMPSEDAQTLDE